MIPWTSPTQSARPALPARERRPVSTAPGAGGERRVTDRTRYLLALYVAERDGSPPVSSGDLASALDRSPAATTEMLQRLDSRGLVRYEPYEGATLTEEGRETATELFETYRILSRFFREVLGLDDYEEEAVQLAGTISPAVADRLASTVLSDTDESDDGALALPLTERFQ